MRIGLMSDIHGNAPALKAALSVLQDRVDLILFLGDMAGYYRFVNECVELLRSYRIIGVRGNHDQILLDCLEHQRIPEASYRARYGSALERSLLTLTEEARLLIHSWPAQRCLSLSSIKISISHGAPWEPLEGRVYPDFRDWHLFEAYEADIFLVGHTHYQLVKRWKDKLIINPGSVGQPRDCSRRACYAVLDLTLGDVKVILERVPYDPTIIIKDAHIHDPGIPYLREVLTR